MITLFASIFVFGMLIFAHEFGHYIAAKASGIHVIEFAIGFGPRIIGWEGKETKYSLRAFPLGGFCRMLGEDPSETGQKGSFQEQSLFHRFLVIAAGPLMNFFLAVILFSLIYFLFLGVPLEQSTVIGDVTPEGRAEEVGFQSGDKILSINEENVESWDEVVSIINAHPEEELEIKIQRDEQSRLINVVPMREPNTGRGLIGIAPQMERYNILGSLFLGAEYTWWFGRFIVTSIIQMITGQMPPEVAGPVGIIRVVGEVAETGFSNLLSLAAVISINLGIINLLPIPALDGSRLIFILIEGIRGKPVDPEKESFIHFVGFAVLIMLIFIITYHDLLNIGLF